jgi:hypothetical protein
MLALVAVTANVTLGNRYVVSGTSCHGAMVATTGSPDGYTWATTQQGDRKGRPYTVYL